MGKNKHTGYSALISERILLLAKNSGLTITGLSEITKVSESHIYALINGNKKLKGDIAEKLGRPFKLQGWQLLRLDFEIPSNFNKSSDLISFRKEFKGNIEYFYETKNKIKTSHFIENEFLNNPIFNEPVYLWEIIEKLKSIGKQYSSKDLSQILHYLIIKNKLLSEKRPLKLKHGGFGSRLVDVFFKEL
jgi:plasmid maintenance system antidote protein VapI